MVVLILLLMLVQANAHGLDGSVYCSRDGEVTFAASQGESYDIYKLTPEGQAELIVSDGIQPAWSPDGLSLAFTTYRDSNLEIYLADHLATGLVP